MENDKNSPREEDPAARAKWLAEQMRFKVKEAMAQRGGADAFLHFLRTGGENNG